MDFKIILLCAIAGIGWLYLIANHVRYARQVASIDYDALASYRMKQPGADGDVEIFPID